MTDHEEIVPLTLSSSAISNSDGMGGVPAQCGQGFITSSSFSPQKYHNSSACSSNARAKTSASDLARNKILKIFLLVLLIVLMVSLYNHELTKFNGRNCSSIPYPPPTSDSSTTTTTTGFGHGDIMCPSQLKEARNDQTLKWYKDNVKVQKNPVAWTAEQVENLKKEKIDGWNRNYHQLKAFKKDWKIRHFSSLKSGDSIFESACGKGINLLFTVELLKEHLGIENLHVSGIEYRQDAAVIANSMLRTALPIVG